MRVEEVDIPFTFELPDDGEMIRQTIAGGVYAGNYSLMFNSNTGFRRIDLLWGPANNWPTLRKHDSIPGSDVLIHVGSITTPQGSLPVLYTKTRNPLISWAHILLFVPSMLVSAILGGITWRVLGIVTETGFEIILCIGTLISLLAISITNYVVGLSHKILFVCDGIRFVFMTRRNGVRLLRNVLDSIRFDTSKRTVDY